MEGDPPPSSFGEKSPYSATVDLVLPSSYLNVSSKILELLVVFERDFSNITVDYQRDLMIQLWNNIAVESRVRLVTDDRFISKLKGIASKLASSGVLDGAPNTIGDSSNALITVWNAIDQKNKLKLLNFVRNFERTDSFNLSRSSNAMQKSNFGSDQDTVCQLAATHVPQSFKRSFSKHKVACSPIKLCLKLSETPIKSFGDVSSIDGTPSKLISTPINATPAQSAGRRRVRGFMTPDENEDSPRESKSAPSKLTRHSSRRRLFDDDDILSRDLFASLDSLDMSA